ncbi:MAG: response regulator [Bauldia sp.]|uniref:response regulator n=1 Tax=Bauldia sp. TaxID=2575872 RepID=UPI001DE11D86|nr:response regulator [Bauldia sp.]MCB1496718.1 response regulator [Bauldia sp.]
MRQCLVVDDSSVVRKVARRIFEDLGFSVGEAEDGEQALESCRRGMPDMIMVDWNMPRVSGVEFLTALRAADGGDRPMVLFCASENDAGHITRALRAGADDYLLKPFNREIIEAKLQEVGIL